VKHLVVHGRVAIRVGDALFVTKPEMKEEQNDDEAAKAARVVEYERR
jgi:hypothetical protein